MDLVVGITLVSGILQKLVMMLGDDRLTLLLIKYSRSHKVLIYSSTAWAMGSMAECPDCMVSVGKLFYSPQVRYRRTAHVRRRPKTKVSI